MLHVHDRNPLAESDVPVTTRMEDLAVLCANCHALVHSDPTGLIAVEDLQVMLAAEQKA